MGVGEIYNGGKMWIFIDVQNLLGDNMNLDIHLFWLNGETIKEVFTDRVSEKFNASLCSYRIGKSVSDQVKMSIGFYKPIALVFAVSGLVACKCRHVQKFRYPEV